MVSQKTFCTVLLCDLFFLKISYKVLLMELLIEKNRLYTFVVGGGYVFLFSTGAWEIDLTKPGDPVFLIFKIQIISHLKLKTIN